MDHRRLLALQLLFRPCARTLAGGVTSVPTPINISPSPPWIMDSVWKGRSPGVWAWKLWSVQCLDEQFRKHDAMHVHSPRDAEGDSLVLQIWGWGRGSTLFLCSQLSHGGLSPWHVCLYTCHPSNRNFWQDCPMAINMHSGVPRPCRIW